jgi:hypothetical protein
MQAKYPPPAPSIQYYVETECGHTFQWAAVDMESLFLRIHEKNYRAKTVMTWEEHEAKTSERELKESA